VLLDHFVGEPILQRTCLRHNRQGLRALFATRGWSAIVVKDFAPECERPE